MLYQPFAMLQPPRYLSGHLQQRVLSSSPLSLDIQELLGPEECGDASIPGVAPAAQRGGVGAGVPCWCLVYRWV